MSLPEKPLTRRELYLAKAAGQDVTLPETDLTREEMYLREIANGSGGGDVTKEYVDTAIANAVADIDDDISALSDTVADKVDKENGKGLSTNDYTDADKALVQDSPITTTSTTSLISTANGKPRKLAIYGKSEIVDGVIKSAGEGYAVVDLGALAWTKITDYTNPIFIANVNGKKSNNLNYVCAKYVTSNIITGPTALNAMVNREIGAGANNTSVYICDTNPAYTNAAAFKAAMSGVLLCYKEATPTNNTIAVKTDNGSGIDGTMATFTTGTPLRGIPDSDVRDVMAWDGSAGTVTKNCGEVDLGTLTWGYNSTLASNPFFYASDINIKLATSQSINANLVCAAYNTYSFNTTLYDVNIDKAIGVNSVDNAYKLVVKNTDYTDATAFKTAMSGVKLIYELATPTTQSLTSTENASIAGLRTFTPQTHIQNNASTDMAVEAYAGTANGQAVQELENRIKSEIDEVKNEKSHFCYSYKIDMSDSNPETCVKPHFDPRYGCDNFNFTSAHMDYANDRFDYGSWEGFIRRIARPCMLKFDGTVDYYLDPDDYSKKITGEASDVADVNYQGNAMVELEKLYFKRYTHNGIQYCFIADRKLDKSFKAYAHHDKYGKELDYIYRACYDGMYDGTRLRSISGVDYHNLNTLTAGYIMSNATRQEEMNFAKANNVSTEQGEGWNILHKSEWDYINDILVLISMSTDTQGTFGRGRDGEYVSTSDTGIISTGTMDTKGLFWGKNDSTAGVKVLGIENHWANIWKSCAGWMLKSNQHYTKMTFGTEDGSTGTGFNTDGTGYLATGASISANGYISDWAENDNGFLPTVASGSASTYRCDYVWQSTATCFALVGGSSGHGLRCGAFCAYLAHGAGSRDSDVGAALSYKPLSAA